MPKTKLVVLISLVCSVLYFAPVFAIADSSPVKVQISAYGSNEKSERGLFSTDFIVPLYYSQDKDTLVFFNPKYTYTTPSADEVNQGLGLRHIFNDSFILGLNAFFDRRLSHSGKWYSQAGLGLEYLSHPLDVRLNWYKPLTRSKMVDTGYRFASTSLIQYDDKEEPLQGLDFEIGVPVFDQYTRTRLFLGGFFYQSRLSKDVNGFRARTETSLTKWLSFDTTFKSKTDGQTEFYGGVRVILPFEWTNLFGKKSKQKSQAPVVSNSYLEDRIFDRVVRDIDIQLKASTSQLKVHDLTYVDNSNTSGTANGSLEHPYTTVQLGVNNAFGDKWVYVKEGLSRQSAPTYYATVDFTSHDDVVLWGSGYNGGFNGIAAPGFPVINGGTNGITLGNGNTVMGMQAQGAGNDGIIKGATTLTGVIKYNYLYNNTNDGIDLSANSDTMDTITVSNNTSNNNGNAGIDLANNSGGMTNITISNNITNNNSFDGVDLSGNSGTMDIATISNNTANNNYDGIDLADNSGTMTNFTISSNTTGESSTNYNTHNGISLSANSGTMRTFTISNNTSNNNTNDAMDLSANSGTMDGFTISDNTTKNNGNAGIDQSGNSGTMDGFTLSNNTS